MHMADALVSPAVAGTMYACSAAAAAYSVRQVRLDTDTKKVPVMGVMGAFVFAAQMINFTIPGTGSSGHLCGGMLLSALLGPCGGFLTMIGVLLIQCLFFADGGLLALGCNIWNMAFYGCFIGSLLIWKPMMKKGFTRGKIIAASVLGCVLTLQMGAFSVVLETTASGVTELPAAAFAAVMQPIHLAIGLVEGLITAAVLVFVITAGLLSLAASSSPDGLEWSMEKVAGSAELEAEGELWQRAEAVQEATAVLPDYGFAGTQSAGGTAVSGIVGAAAVLLLCVGACLLFQFFKRRKRT